MTELIWSVTEPAAALAAFFAAPLLPKRLVPSTPSVAEMVAPPCLVFLNRPPIVPPIRPPMAAPPGIGTKLPIAPRSEEHTSELQSLMRPSYAVFCLTKKNTKLQRTNCYTTTPNRPLDIELTRQN